MNYTNVQNEEKINEFIIPIIPLDEPKIYEKNIRIYKGVENNEFGHSNIISFLQQGKEPYNHIQMYINNGFANDPNTIYANSEISVKHNDSLNILTINKYALNNTANMTSDFLYYDNNNPTIVFGLFVGGDDFLNNNYRHFVTKYMSTQIRAILSFKHKFPYGNVRFYFDELMLNVFKNITKNNPDMDNINLLSKMNEFQNFEYDSEDKKNMDVVYKSYLEHIRKENYEFKNGLERFLYYYDTACRYNCDNGISYTSPITGEFFSYRFKRPFIEYYMSVNNGQYRLIKFNDAGICIDDNLIKYDGIYNNSLVINNRQVNFDNSGTYEDGNIKIRYCHITKGFIGQYMRYIVVFQKKYVTNIDNTILTIDRPKHIIWRDGHMNTPGKYDAEWIRKFNDYGKKIQKLKFIIPTSLYYETSWHNAIKCDTEGPIKDQKFYRSAIAGQVQYINFSNDEYFIPKDELKNLFGIPFLIQLNMDGQPYLPLSKIKTQIAKNNQYMNIHINTKYLEYGYGIDEFVLSGLFSRKFYTSRTIYFTHYFIDQLFRDNDYKIINYETFKLALSPIYVAMAVMLYFLRKCGMINEPHIKSDVIRVIENIRNLYFKNDKYINEKILNFINFINHVDKNTHFGRNKLTETLNVVLGIIPNRYHICQTIYQSNNTEGNDDPSNRTESVDYIIKFVALYYIYATKNNKLQFGTVEYLETIKKIGHLGKFHDHLDMSEIDMLYADIYNNPKKYNLSVSLAYSHLSHKNWCIRNVMFNKDYNDNYYYGFYEGPANGVLRYPDDVRYITENTDTIIPSAQKTDIEKAHMGGTMFYKYLKYKNKYLNLGSQM